MKKEKKGSLKSLATHITAAQSLRPSLIWSLHSKDSKFTELGHPKSQKILCREIHLVHANILYSAEMQICLIAVLIPVHDTLINGGF